MGARGIHRFLKQWHIDGRDLHRRLILAPTPRKRETMARHLAPSPGMDGFGYGAGFGTGSSHHRTMGRRMLDDPKYSRWLADPHFPARFLGPECWDPHTEAQSCAAHFALRNPAELLSQWLGHGQIHTTLVHLELAPDPSGSLASVP